MTSPMIDAGDGLPLTFPALWRRQVRDRADALLLVCDNERLTWREADARSRRIAKGLIAAGAGKGAHVALLFPNSADFLVCMLGAIRIGALVLPLSTLSTADELGWLLVNSDTGYLLATPSYRAQDFAAMLPKAVAGLDFSDPPHVRAPNAPWLRHIWFAGPEDSGRHGGWSLAALEAMGQAVEDATLDAIEDRVTPADRAVIIHTSGSTSHPKGVIHTHGALIRHLDNINQVREFAPGDILFATSPWFWVAGFAFGLVGTLVAGARIICSNAVEPAAVLDVIEHERPTMVNGYAPLAVRYANDPSFARRDLSFIRRGNLHPILPADIRPRDPELRHNIYGMTEAGGALTMSGDETDQPEHRRGSLGRLLPGYEAKIVDPDTLEQRAPGEVGELWIRGPFLMEGYYGRHHSETFEADGWWRTGDMCWIDADGFFYIAGRRGDMIKTSGANVAPKEVEGVLRSLTGAAECIVVGLPDPERGEVVAGVVIDAEFDEVLVRQEAATKLSRYKVPRRIIRLDRSELPLLSSGKVDVKSLKDLVQSRW